MRALVSVFLLTVALLAQEYDVASIKPSAPDARGTYIRPSPGGLVLNNMSLKEMIQIAYQVQPFQVTGGPPWMDSVHYDVTARSEGNAGRPMGLQFQEPMMQALLADRFEVKIHKETKEQPIYKLVLARKDGKLGDGLVPTKEGSCEKLDPAHPPEPPRPGDPPRNFCGTMMMGPDRMSATAAQIANLIPMLSRILGRSVVDETGLKGDYNVTVEWTPDETQVSRPRAAGQNGPPPDSNLPTLFTAFQERLGLKLEAGKGPVEIIVVDQAEKPSEN